MSHVGKPMGTAFRNLVSNSSKIGATLGGRMHGCLSQETMSKLQIYYSRPIRNNKTATETQKAILASLYHGYFITCWHIISHRTILRPFSAGSEGMMDGITTQHHKIQGSLKALLLKKRIMPSKCANSMIAEQTEDSIIKDVPHQGSKTRLLLQPLINALSSLSEYHQHTLHYISGYVA